MEKWSASTSNVSHIISVVKFAGIYFLPISNLNFAADDLITTFFACKICEHLSVNKNHLSGADSFLEPNRTAAIQFVNSYRVRAVDLCSSDHHATDFSEVALTKPDDLQRHLPYLI